jgi:hypothetical protein
MRGGPASSWFSSQCNGAALRDFDPAYVTTGHEGRFWDALLAALLVRSSPDSDRKLKACLSQPANDNRAHSRSRASRHSRLRARPRSNLPNWRGSSSHRLPCVCGNSTNLPALALPAARESSASICTACWPRHTSADRCRKSISRRSERQFVRHMRRACSLCHARRDWPAPPGARRSQQIFPCGGLLRLFLRYEQGKAAAVVQHEGRRQPREAASLEIKFALDMEATRVLPPLFVEALTRRATSKARTLQSNSVGQKVNMIGYRVWWPIIFNVRRR